MQHLDAEEPSGLLLSDDLIFSSRITATARSAGGAMKVARSVAELERLAGEHGPACVILDLANPGLLVTEMVKRLRSAEKAPVIIAYGSHVDAAGLHAARQAGCDLVLPRSKFVEDLPTALPRWLGGET